MTSQNKLRMPGATLTTRLKVYDTAGPDGQIGGTPHSHLCCSEMYYVTAGSGAVEIIDSKGFSRVELPLYAGYLFNHGTIHRLINPNRDLELFVIMQNSGLPERGDNAVVFEAEIMASGSRIAEAMSASSIEDVYRRRDAGVRGFLELKHAFERSLEEGRAALSQFYQRAAEYTAGRRAEWRQIVEEGSLFEAKQALQDIEDLDRGDTEYLMHSAQHLILPQEHVTRGFCGRLNRYFDPATHPPEGHLK